MDYPYKCIECNKSCKSLLSYSKHYRMFHNKPTSEWMDLLVKHHPEVLKHCVICDKIMRVVKTSGGSSVCKNKSCKKEIHRKGPQSPEHIQKRVSSTNQVKKEATRKNTMIERYGNTNFGQFFTPEMRSKSYKGLKKSDSHIRNIILSKRRNGTINHSLETRMKVSASLKRFWTNNDNPPVIVPRKYNGNHKHGYYNGFYYRSSYELKFLTLCERFNISLVSAENSTYRVMYYLNGNIKFYYPDFYMVDHDLVIEIKPSSMIKYGSNITKITAARKRYGDGYLVVTEKVLKLSPEEFYEYILSRSRSISSSNVSLRSSCK